MELIELRSVRQNIFTLITFTKNCLQNENQWELLYMSNGQLDRY